jgi:hypothetical protein
MTDHTAEEEAEALYRREIAVIETLVRVAEAATANRPRTITSGSCTTSNVFEKFIFLLVLRWTPTAPVSQPADARAEPVAMTSHTQQRAKIARLSVDSRIDG